MNRSVLSNSIDSIIHQNEVDVYSTNRFKKIDQPKTENLINLLINIEKKNTTKNMVDNIYNVALSYPLFILNKDKKYQLESSFKSFGEDDLKIKTFDGQKIAKYFDFSKNKLLIQFIKGCKVNDLKREISELCLLIILYSLQDKVKRFRIFKKFFKGITQETQFKKHYLVDQKFLDKLKPQIRDHQNRPGLASTIVDTLSKFNSKDLNKKFDTKRQRKLIKFIKKFFYLNNYRICQALEKIQLKICGDDLFYAGLQLLDHSDCKDELNHYLPILSKIQSTNNSINNNQTLKRRITVAMKPLFIDENNLGEYKLCENLKTISLFMGLLNLRTEYFKKIEIINLNQINSKFYALGILLKRFLILIQIENQIILALENDKSIKIDYLKKYLNILDDRSICKYPEILKQGIDLIKIDPFFLNQEYRKELFDKANQIEILKRSCVDNQKRKEDYIVHFLKEQKSTKLNKLNFIHHLRFNDKFIYLINNGENDSNSINTQNSLELNQKLDLVESYSSKNNTIYSNTLNSFDDNKTADNLSIKDENDNDLLIEKANSNNSLIKDKNLTNNLLINTERSSKKHKLNDSKDEKPPKKIRLIYKCDDSLENKEISKLKSKNEENKVITEIFLDMESDDLKKRIKNVDAEEENEDNRILKRII